MFRRFKSDQDEIWQESSSRKYASIFDLTSRIQYGGHGYNDGL